jgi:hypothetical protein
MPAIWGYNRGSPSSEVIRFHMPREHKRVNFNNVWFNFSPLKSSTRPFPSSSNKWREIKLLLTNKAIVKDVIVAHNKPRLQSCSSSPKRIFYTSLLQLDANGCPSGSWLLKDLEICEQHNTFYNYKFVDRWVKSRRTYRWWYKLRISRETA